MENWGRNLVKRNDFNEMILCYLLSLIWYFGVLQYLDGIFWEDQKISVERRIGKNAGCSFPGEFIGDPINDHLITSIETLRLFEIIVLNL